MNQIITTQSLAPSFNADQVDLITRTLCKGTMAPGKSQSGYMDDYAAVAPLQKLAAQYNVAIIIVHHDRKMEADDVFDTISGTLGLTGAVDTMLVMKRQGCNVTLHVRGRDIEEADKAIEFDKATCRWTIIGEATEVQRSDERGAILTVLIDATEPMKPGDLSIACGMPRNNIDQLLFKMGRDGEVVKTGRGLYVHPSRSDLLIDLTDLTGRAKGKEGRSSPSHGHHDKIDKKVRNEAPEAERRGRRQHLRVVSDEEDDREDVPFD
jgi:hypothetical protein